MNNYQHIKYCLAFTLFIILIFFIVGCKNNNYRFHEGFAEGTTFHIYYQTKENYDNAIDSLLNHFENILSTYRDSSLISKVNMPTDSVYINNPLFTKMLHIARKVYDETDGAFDITIAPIVNAYGFGFTDTLQTDSALIDSLLQYVGMSKIHISNNWLIKDMRHIQIDGNAIAKGQSVDYICNFLDAKGIENYMVEIGGEVRVKGVNTKGQPWQIGIDRPIDGSNEVERDLQGVVALKDKSIATSGNYRRFYYKNGLRYSHTIDPKTGYPVNHGLLSASVMTKTCMLADAYATSFMVMGLNKVKIFLKNHPQIDAYLIYRDENDSILTFSTRGFVVETFEN